MNLSITSEIGCLQSVLVHLPGKEIDRMLPSMMGDLLFDDILFGNRARDEHRRLQRVIAHVADEVLVLRDLLEQTLQEAESRRALLNQLSTSLPLDPQALAVLDSSSAPELARRLIEGIVRPGVEHMPENAADLYLLPPIPNLVFHRDPAVVVHDGVVLASMATRARLREPLLIGHVLRHHRRFAGASPVSLLFERFDADFRRLRSTARPRPTLEGGDVLVLSGDVLVVGASIRTARHTIEDLLLSLQARGSPIHTILVVDLPRSRSYMHLDTVFTVISEDECLVYEPVVLRGQVEQAAVYQLDLTDKGIAYTSKDCLLSALGGLGIDLKPIVCGGPDPIAQQREQWTDGANAFALAPGVILLYARNVHTAEQLDRAGYEILAEDDLLLRCTEPDASRRDLADGRKRAVLIKGDELSRARGGPRCLTMPLCRAPL